MRYNGPMAIDERAFINKKRASWERLSLIIERTKHGGLRQLSAEELPALPLYFRADAFILPKWLQGLTPTGHQFPSTLWVENWRAVGRGDQASAR